MTKKEDYQERLEAQTRKKKESIVRLLKASIADIKSTLDCVDEYEIEDMDFDEGHTWANGAADKIGNALAMIKELRG